MWRCNLILFLCVLERKGGGDVVKLTIVTLKTPFSHLVML